AWPGNAKDEHRVAVTKELRFAESAEEFSVECRVAIKRNAESARTTAVRFQTGIEVVLNFLAPNEQNRYFEFGRNGSAIRERLAWGGEAGTDSLKIVDEWQNIACTFECANGNKIWISPIETVSESEEGFERVYQGSQILGVSSVELEADREW